MPRKFSGAGLFTTRMARSAAASPSMRSTPIVPLHTIFSRGQFSRMRRVIRSRVETIVASASRSRSISSSSLYSSPGNSSNERPCTTSQPAASSGSCQPARFHGPVTTTRHPSAIASLPPLSAAGDRGRFAGPGRVYSRVVDYAPSCTCQVVRHHPCGVVPRRAQPARPRVHARAAQVQPADRRAVLRQL
jgi:hypothetical protein